MKLLDWFYKWVPFNRPSPNEDDPLKARATVLINAAESFDASGEYKRHKVYAQLLKEYPDQKKHDLALIMELIIQDLRSK